MLLSRAQCLLARALLVVRDEEAASSNPVTPTVFPQVSDLREYSAQRAASHLPAIAAEASREQ
jgi:hypothetical protein